MHDYVIRWLHIQEVLLLIKINCFWGVYAYVSLIDSLRSEDNEVVAKCLVISQRNACLVVILADRPVDLESRLEQFQ